MFTFSKLDLTIYNKNFFDNLTFVLVLQIPQRQQNNVTKTFPGQINS